MSNTEMASRSRDELVDEDTSAPSAPGPEAFKQAARGDDEVRIPLQFKWMAILSVGTFVFLLVLTGIVTFTSTAYSEETDVVYQYFGVFNPCAWFDHEPANAVGVVLIAPLVLNGAVMSLSLFLFVYKLDDLLLLVGGGFVLSLKVFLEVCFINAFTANLYAPEHNLVRDDGTIRLQPGDSGDTPIIQLHTTWYILYLMGHVAQIAVLQRILAYIRRCPWWLTALLAATGLVLTFASAKMLLTISLWSPEEPRWEDDRDSFLQEFMFWVSKTRIGVWHFIPALFYPFALPLDNGVCLRLSLARRGAEDATSPHSLVSLAFAILGVGVFFSYLMQDPTRENGTHLILASGLQEDPYNYFFAPLWILVFMLFSAGVVFTIAQLVLKERHAGRPGRGPVVVAAAAVGCLMVLAMITGLWLLTPDAIETHGVPPAVFVVLFPVWVLLSSGGARPATIVYCALFAASAAASVVDDQVTATVGNAVMLTLLIFFHFMTPPAGDENGQMPHVAVDVALLKSVRDKKAE